MTAQAALQEMREFERRFRGMGLTTAQIWYTKPGHPKIINPHWFLWQFEDEAPLFPRLLHFVNDWPNHRDGMPKIVRVSHNNLVRPQDFDIVNGEFRLN